MDKKTVGTSINFLEEIANFIFTDKYARYNDIMSRRETWDECVGRVEKMHLDKFKKILPKEDLDDIRWAFNMVREKRVVPSMRSMQFGGKAVLAHNARLFNCAVRHIDSPRSFAEVFYLLLAGCGVGIGITKHFVDRLPRLVNSDDKNGTVVTYTIQDTIEGWSDSVEALLNCYLKNTAYSGRKIVFDYSRIRPEGAPLKTGGGKAPGYKSLKRCHKKMKELLDYIIEEENQTYLKPINVYDIIMHTSDAVLAGGVRRSALIAIFDLDDEDMLNAKTLFTVTKHTQFQKNEKDEYEGYVYVDGKHGGQKRHKYEVTLTEFEYNQVKDKKLIAWNHIEKQRARSNNSALILRDKITKEQFTKISNMTQQFGEPGFIFTDHPHALVNPCAEIQFIPVTEDGLCGVQFCNLSSINGVKVKTEQDYLDCTKAATILGTLQASYTDFKYLSHTAKKLTDEEALLGVSITGFMDNPHILLDSTLQEKSAKYAVKVNEEWAKKLGINKAARITTCKPEGTSSLVLGSGSGIHPHHAHKYFRRVQVNKLSPVYKFFKKQNAHMCEESVWSANKSDDIITFPIEIPLTAKVKADFTAIEHLDIIKSTQKHWVIPGSINSKKNITHNVSCTVIVDRNDWDKVFDYLFENRNYFTAVSLLPRIGDKIYKQAPMESIETTEDKAKWDNIIGSFTSVNYKNLIEDDDNTKLADTVACTSGSCDQV